MLSLFSSIVLAFYSFIKVDIEHLDDPEQTFYLFILTCHQQNIQAGLLLSTSNKQ